MRAEDLTLKQKILQMFIVGFNGQNYAFNRNFTELLKQGLGGIIFFTHNISTEKQFKELISNLSKDAPVPMFYSIDQEGGRVERTEKIHGGKKYLSAKQAFEMGISYLQNQTKEIALELKSYGINMNFAPVLDVNTTEENPVIGERAFSANVDEVTNAGKVVIREYEKYGIISVGKHFPGHGAATADSHRTLPVIDLPKDEIENIHIKPFKEAINIGLNSIMAAHVLYPQLDSENPASVSKKIINDILINNLGFEGLIITDDMEMNGIKGLSRIEACTKAINAGISMFIFRDTTKDIVELINDIETAVKTGLIPEDKINTAVNKIFNIKEKYAIL
jgi:beta-N-acetylhexosaminidase